MELREGVLLEPHRDAATIVRFFADRDVPFTKSRVGSPASAPAAFQVTARRCGDRWFPTTSTIVDRQDARTGSLRGEDVPAALADAVRRAALQCPERAVHVAPNGRSGERR